MTPFIECFFHDLGQHFQEQEEKDVYITSRLNLKLPKPVDDLIPPSTLISTKPTILTAKPEWRTTLVYYISRPILSRLRRRQAQVTLEVTTVSEKGERDCIGSMILQMDEAKLVLIKDGKRDISQVQRFVVDKGDWLTISENSRSKVKAGLFIVEMPNNTNAQNKPVGTPLQLPVRTTPYNNKGARADMGLEICSDVSELFIDDDEQEYDDEDLLDSLLLDEDEDREDYEQDMMNVQLEKDDEEEEDAYIIPIGDGQDQYSFCFRISEANHLASITNKYANNVNAFFRYDFAEKEFQCEAEYDEDNWLAMQYANNVLLQGHLKDIIAWLNEQACITVYLIIHDVEQDKQEVIGFSHIYLTGRELGVINQSYMVYDEDRIWHINENKQFSVLQLQIGLTRGWEELDYSLLKE